MDAGSDGGTRTEGHDRSDGKPQSIMASALS